MLVPLLLAVALPSLVPIRWFSAEPASLDLLRDTPVNCVLLDKQQWSAPFLAEVHKRNLVALAVIRPQPDPAADARRAVELRFEGAVLEGAYDTAVADRLSRYLADSRLLVIRMGLRSDLRLDAASDRILATDQGVWPGLQAGQDEAKAAPSGAPWIDTNTGFLRFVRACSDAPVWIGNLPPAGTAWPVERYLQAIGDAAMTGARWVIALDDAFQKKLLSRDPTAMKNWSRISQALAFYDAHPEWHTAQAAGRLALIEDSPTGALLSGGVLDMIAVKHTPVRPVPSPRLKAEMMQGSNMAVNIDADSLTESQKEALKAFTRAGGTLLTGPPGWKFPAPAPGQITLQKADLEKLDQIWREMNAMTGRRNLGARLFNVASMLSNLVQTGDGKLALHLVNYSDYPVENVTVHVLGQFQSATLYRPDASPLTIQGYEVEDGTGFDIEQLGALGTLVFKPK